MGAVRNNILIYIQQDATLHGLFYLETALLWLECAVGAVRNNILIYIQQDTTLHSLFYLETALHVSGGTSTYHQGRIKLYLQHLVFVTPLLLPVAIVEELELLLMMGGGTTRNM